MVVEGGGEGGRGGGDGGGEGDRGRGVLGFFLNGFVTTVLTLLLSFFNMVRWFYLIVLWFVINEESTRVGL